MKIRGEKDGRHWRADQEAHGYPETLRPLSADEAYAYAIALEDAREAARAAEKARADTLKEATVLEGEIIAWRNWCFNKRAGLLESTAASTLWPTDEPLWEPRVSTDFGLGIHAYKTKSQAMEFAGIYVTGTVRLWGTVFEYKGGYKAEFAQVNSIDRVSQWAIDRSMLVPFKGRIWRWRLRKRYGLR